MEIITPKEWSLKTETTSQEREKTQLAIKNEAKKICERRIRKAAELKAQVEDLANKKKQLDSFINSIRESLCVEKNEQTKATIEQICGELEADVEKYQSKLDELKEHFENQKIRVLSFGSKSQGKSSFTKAYTNLSDAIIGTKAKGNIDKTGSTSVIIHKKGIPVDSPEIYVVFKSPNTILNTVNQCFASLGMSYHYSNWVELYDILKIEEDNNGNVIANGNKKRIYEAILKFEQSSAIIKNFGSIKATLKWIFNPISDFSDVNTQNKDWFNIKKGKKIPLSNLSQYNDMTNKSRQSFTSVAEIHIFVDLGHGDMFEDFEICDTKGISVEAGGGIWEKEIYDLIGKSDAAFSVQATGSGSGGQSDTKFYEDLNSERENNSSLKDMELKHFAIINPWEKGDEFVPIEGQGVIPTIRDSRIANTIYVGPLKDGVVYDGQKCVLQDFVDYVIHDMMKKIVSTTNQTDENLLEERKSYEEKIKDKKEELVKQLHAYDKMSPRKEDDIIRDSVEKWLLETGIPGVGKVIRSFAEDANVPLTFLTGDQKEITVEIRNGKKVASIFDDGSEEIAKDKSNVHIESKTTPKEQISYMIPEIDEQKVKEGLFEIITGESKFPNSLNEKDVYEIVKEAISVLYERVKSDIGKKKNPNGSESKGSYIDIGAYIDDASDLINRKIIDNVNNKFAPDKELPGSLEFKNKLFNSIWKALKLDVLYKEFDGGILKKIDKNEKKNNDRLENWSIPYNLNATIPSAPPVLPPPSFMVLKHYFDKQKEDVSIGKISSYLQVAIQEQDLISAIQEAYIVYDFPTRYKLKRNEEFKWKAELCQHLWADVEGSISRFKEEVIELYKYACPTPKDYVHKLKTAEIIKEDIAEECTNQNRILELQKQRSNLSNLTI